MGPCPSGLHLCKLSHRLEISKASAHPRVLAFGNSSSSLCQLSHAASPCGTTEDQKPPFLAGADVNSETDKNDRDKPGFCIRRSWFPESCITRLPSQWGHYPSLPPCTPPALQGLCLLQRQNHRQESGMSRDGFNPALRGFPGVQLFKLAGEGLW